MAAWWAPKSSQTTASSAMPAVMDVGYDGETCIDLTSDTETSPSPAAAAAPATSSSSNNGVSPWVVKMTAKNEVKYEGMKRAAEASAKAQQSGEVLVTDKPSQPIEEVPISRPAKRSKGSGAGASPSQDEDGEEEEDMEVVGTTGTAKLPHNRFACTEHVFDGPHDSSGHKEKCSLCFCYVCDMLARDCQAWADHCHATDSGPMKSSWKLLRNRAKVYCRAGMRPPVSGRYLHSSGGASSSSGSAVAATSQVTVPPAAAASPGNSSGASSNRNTTVENSCKCEALCKPIFDVFSVVTNPSVSKAAVVYLAGLTQQQVQHVEDISIKSTLEYSALKNYRENHSGVKRSASSKASILQQIEKRLKPTVRVAPAGNGVSNVTVAANGEICPDPFKFRWRAGVSGLAQAGVSGTWAVRLGRVGSIKFSIESDTDSKRQEYFDRFVSEKPMAPSVWYSCSKQWCSDYNVGVGLVSIAEKEDHDLVRLLKRAYEGGLIDVEAAASFDSVANSGSFSLEIILLSKLIHRGTSLSRRQGESRHDVFDFLPLVERCVLNRVHKPTASSSSSSKGKKKAHSSSFGPLSPVVNGVPSHGGGSSGSGDDATVPGRRFAPSMKGHGGRASLNVSLAGLIDSVRDEERNKAIQGRRIIHPTKMLLELENLQHRSLAKQPECLTVELYEHQKQDAQWMYDQEKLEGGSMQHLWAELPAHHLAPPNGQRSSENEFRRCWFSPVLNQFTITNPFASTIKGGILCDEMGLGKTAATLCLHLIHPPKTPSPGVPLDEKEWGPISGKQATELLYNKNYQDLAPKDPGTVVSKGTLVVCKVSLVGQWVEEAKRLCGGALSIYPYHGGSRKRDPAFLANFDVVVTTYGVVQTDAAHNRGYPPLRRIRWWRVVLDESHTIAASNSTTNHVKELVSNRRWCMTGTPYISRFSDVNGQLAFLGAEGAFKASDLGDKGANYNTQQETVAFLRRVLLRHSQGMQLGGHSILGLPTITHKVEVLNLSTNERKAYVEFEKGLQDEYIKVRYRLRNHAGSHTMEVLTLLSKFRQACSGGQLLVGDSSAGGSGGGSASSVDAFCPMCNEIIESPVRTLCGHTFCQACITSVLTKAKDDEGPCPKCKKTVKLTDLVAVGGGPISSGTGAGSSHAAKSEPQQYGGLGGGSNGYSMYGGCYPNPSFASPASTAASEPASGVIMETKLNALVQKLADIHAEDPTSKSLVFSQFNSSLEWLKRTLPKKGFQFRTLTGAMSMKQRTDALTAFAKDPPTTVFLLSVRSGAVGINLTQANNVFLLEPLLNLALEKQAIGRVYRLGQARPVTVTKLVLYDSIETRILALQEQQAATGSASAAVGAPSSSSSNGVAGNIARDNAKNLRIEEYNALFGVN